MKISCPYCLHGWRRDVEYISTNGEIFSQDEECSKCQGIGFIEMGEE